jgi:FkbH-like protein
LEKYSEFTEVTGNVAKDRLQVCLTATFVIEPLQDYLEYWCNEFELAVDFHFAPYNQVFQQLLDPNSLLNQNTGLNFLFVRIEDWLRDVTEMAIPAQIEFLGSTFQGITKALQQSRKQTNVPFLIGIVPLSPAHTLSQQTADYIKQLNFELQNLIKDLPATHQLDLEKVATVYEVDKIFDRLADEMGHLPFSQEYYAALGTSLTRKIRAFAKTAFKVIAIDCDNTLWKGVCGEEGALNVVIDSNYAYLQQFLLEKYNEGFLLALCTKNNEDDVWEVFDRHPGMILKREHIAARRINWNPKSGNLASIAKELNLGIDSFIFLDDSAFEIEQMSYSYPEVLCITVPEEPSTFRGFLNHIWQFDVFQVTEEDVLRNSMYRAEKQRKEELVNYEDLDTFLKSLGIEVHLEKLEEKDLDRALQLTLRTNQFNLNGIRKTREELAGVIDNSDMLKWIVEVKDRFGNYGKVGLLIATQSQNALEIETFLLSCRVLGRKVENIIVSELKQYCLSKELGIIKAKFIPTQKNKPFFEFLKQAQWVEDDKNNTYNYLVKSKKQHLTAENEV